MILQSMLQRLFASLMRGPGLNARPHRSRQRIDAADFRHLGALPAESWLTTLLERGSVELPATLPAFQKPEEPESEWPPELKTRKQAAERQSQLLGKLRDIAQDATDYYNDHGEQALFIGFPLLSVPVGADRFSGKVHRILAPVMLVPVTLRVRRTSRPGVTLELAGDGADKIMANPALLAWIEQQTGKPADDLFTDESGEEVAKELAEALARVAVAAGAEPIDFTPATPLVAVPATEDLPARATFLPSAVLGLLPVSNPGLLRDTRWMLENESSLGLPVAAFLKPAALQPATDHELPAATDYDHAATPAGVPDYPAEWLVTQADPCQAGAVAHARRGETLVIHGPPGTGKSQTIANIIGDHLARGEKVLFVCDKRTALDVVKYRLDGMGLGHLCGVIHDPQQDRRDLYLGLRERLQDLPQAAPASDPRRELERVNRRLAELHAELRGNFDQLHSEDEKDGRSFHDLAGEWFDMHAAAGIALAAVEGLTPDLIARHRTDADEVLRRSIASRWPVSPFRDRLGVSLGDFLVKSPAEHRAALERSAAAAEALNEISGEGLPPLTDGSLAEQAAARETLAEALLSFATGDLPDWLPALTTAAGAIEARRGLAELAAHAAALDTPLERELVLQTGPTAPGLADIGRHLLTLGAWQEKLQSWTRLFAFGPKKAAALSLAPLGLAPDPAGTARGSAHYAGLKSRWLWSDLAARLTSGPAESLRADDELRELRDRLPQALALLETLALPGNAAVAAEVIACLKTGEPPAAALAQRLRASAARARAIGMLEEAVASAALFAADTRAGWSQDWRAGAPAGAAFSAMLAAADTLEEAVRREDRMSALPAPLREGLETAALQGCDWAAAEPALKAAALALELRERLRRSPELARLDTHRIESAFTELQERSREKQELVRLHISHLWQQRWKQRLLAGTGSRLNAEGAALRQRLFVRGQKAMKLRQMIAAGAAAEEGDPLFDLCPVWLASPATVAQIFPREPLFDVIVFDEASQCRLEEALPVLLRGRRAVIAGDPKQLPPTRFFEQALAESDDVAAETAEEVFDQQQAEAEDLLTAALNLDVQEAFLDVHYRSRNEALIGFSNDAFYSGRLQPIPGHPGHKALATPIRLHRVEGPYLERSNPAEAKRAAELVAELLDDESPPSIGIACFNITQRDAILDALEEQAAADPVFATRLEAARRRRGRDSFEGLFVKNLENVQGDERDHLIVSTTFGPGPDGKFRRNFGALSRTGGERRLNVLVTRAREAIHVITSIPRAEYLVPESPGEGRKPNGRHYLYDYLRYAERLAGVFERWQQEIEQARRDAAPALLRGETAEPSRIVESIGRTLLEDHALGSTVYWGNDGFRVDIALTHPLLPEDVTIGVLTDFTRYRKSPDPVVWEQFRSGVLRATGWQLHRLWTPALFRDPVKGLEELLAAHRHHLTTTAPPAEEASR